MNRCFRITIFTFLAIIVLNTICMANTKDLYTENDLQSAYIYLKTYRDELAITGYSIDEKNNAIIVYAEEWSYEKEENIKNLIGVKNVTFLIDKGPAKDVDKILVYLKGNQFYTNPNPITIDGRVMVPLRSIFEGLGYKLQWDNSEKKVTGINENGEFSVIIDEPNISLKNSLGIYSTVQMDFYTVIIDNNAYIPLNYVSEITGYTATWLEQKKWIIIE